MRKFFKNLLLIVTLVGTTAWAVLALYFGDSYTGTAQVQVSAVFGLLGFVTIIGLAFDRWRRRLLLTYALLFVAVLTWWWLTVIPLNDRIWQADIAKLAHATINGNKVTVYNIRNADYRSEFNYTTSYYDKTFDLTQLTGVDLFVSYWQGSPEAIAHITISFNFSDKEHLAVSIEARKEEHENFSIIRGFFRQHELIYVVADERDVIRVRTNFRTNPTEQTYLYPIRMRPENARRFFLAYLNRVNNLYEKAEFYNTLMENCATSVWFKTGVDPDNLLPLSWKIVLSGFVPEYLHSVGLLDTSVPFEQLQKQANINAAAQAASQDPDFSKRIREAIRQPR